MVVGKTQPAFDWQEDYPAAVTVCDTDGIIIAMNKRAIEQFAKRGGAELIGTSLFACHPEAANEIIRRQLQTKETNVYITNRKNGSRLIQQVPWHRDGFFCGLVETIIPIPDDITVTKRN